AAPADEAAAPAALAVADVTAGAADDEPARSLDVLAEFRAAAPVTGEQQPPARARLATTAVLFQSPEASTRPRRRRAQASTGSPEEISQAAHAEEPVAPEQVDETVVPAEQPAEQESAGRGRRRGRGGRSRSRRDEQVADDVTVEDVPGAGAPSATDAQDADVDDVDPDDLADDATGDGDDDGSTPRRRRRRGGRGRRGRTDAAGADEDDASADEGEDEQPADGEASDDDAAGDDEQGGSSRRRRRRRRGSRAETGEAEPRRRPASDEVTALRGSTRLEAKRQRRREGRDAGRRRQIITESEFLARRESVERTMVVRERAGRTQIAVLEDGVLVEHYVSHQAQASMVGNVYLGRVQNVLPSMEAAFVDVGKGRNAVLYAGEVNWDAAGLEGQPRRIEQALKSGDPVLVQVTKDPIGHKGARLTSQVTLAGRYLVYVPGGGMTGISRKLPDTERSRLKKILRDVVPDSAGVIVRTAAEGASEEELTADIARLQGQWEAIEKKSRTASAPALLQGEPDMAIRVVRDIFNDDFSTLVVQGDDAHATIASYVGDLAPDLATKVSKWTGTQDLFTVHRVDEQLAKGMDRKVWLPSGGSLVIDRTEAMTVVDVNTGKFTGAGGTLEETVTRNNLEAAEEIVRQLRLRDIGGIIVIDFIDMVLESNRDLVLRRLVECLGRDRTKHQVAEVTSLGLVQMTRKRVGQGLVEAFSETCEHCHGRGFIVHTDPVEKNVRPDAGAAQAPAEGESKRSRRKRATAEQAAPAAALPTVPVLPEAREAVKATLATIAAAAAHAHEHEHDRHEAADGPAEETPTTTQDVVAAATDEPAPAERLDVLAELASTGRLAVDPEPTSAGDPVLELHAVAPEVFAVDEAEDEAVTPEPVDDEQEHAAPPAEEAPGAPAADGQASDEQVPDEPEAGTVP
ncbi:Rne/Rng family ribonuclease, partial [Cellulomonas oligotrophica]